MMSELWTGNGLVNRRTFLRGASAALPAASVLMSAAQLRGADGPPPDARIVRAKEPVNFEFPFATLDSFITPTEKFYVRNHFPLPKVDMGAWRLKIEGAVKKEVELTYDRIRKLPTRTVTATLECAGNNRATLVPKAKGVAWDLGAVSTAEWTGVPLAAVLEEAGVGDGAVEVVLEGADRGEVSGDLRPAPAVLNFARSLPLAKARKPEVLLAYRMNGKELPAYHGFPLRVVVPGWYGMASIKWLQRVIVATHPFDGFFQTIHYSYFGQLSGLPRVVPIQELEVKAEIARPRPGEAVKADTGYKVHGAAWTGDSAVTKVEVSVDGGTTWHEATFVDKSVRFAWRRWEYAWRTPEKAGSATLLSRATDARGRVQPLKRDANRLTYMISHSLPVEVGVR